jgi:hypothetical protein
MSIFRFSRFLVCLTGKNSLEIEDDEESSVTLVDSQSDESESDVYSNEEDNQNGSSEESTNIDEDESSM